MKKFVLFLLGVGMCVSASAQNNDYYQPGAKWNLKVTSDATPDFPTFIYEYKESR